MRKMGTNVFCSIFRLFSASACVIFAFYIIKIRFFFAFFAFFAFFLKVFGHDFSWYCVLCTAQEKYWPKTFRKNVKNAKNAKKHCFYKVKRRKITHANAKKRRKMETNVFCSFFAFFRICMCDFSLFYLIKIRFFFRIFRFFSPFS